MIYDIIRNSSIDVRIRIALRVSEKTSDVRSHRLGVMCDCALVSRSIESSEGRDIRQQALGEEQRRLDQLSKDSEKFRSGIIVSSTNSYPYGRMHVTCCETVEDLLAPLHSHPTTIPLPDVPEDECVWLCTCCQSILGKGIVPPFAYINNKERWLAKIIINFPVDVSQVCNALPRPIDESGVVLVQLSSTSASTLTADRGKDSSSTVPSSSSITTHSSKGYVVRKPRALHWLNNSNTLYADIHIEDGNVTGDDNNNKDNDNDDDDDDENNDD